MPNSLKDNDENTEYEYVQISHFNNLIKEQIYFLCRPTNLYFIGELTYERVTLIDFEEIPNISIVMYKLTNNNNKIFFVSSNKYQSPFYKLKTDVVFNSNDLYKNYSDSIPLSTSQHNHFAELPSITKLTNISIFYNDYIQHTTLLENKAYYLLLINKYPMFNEYNFELVFHIETINDRNGVIHKLINKNLCEFTITAESSLLYRMNNVKCK